MFPGETVLLEEGAHVGHMRGSPGLLQTELQQWAWWLSWTVLSMT